MLKFIVLMVVGILLGLRKRENLFIIFLLSSTFIAIGSLKFVNISFFQIMGYMCSIPMIIIIVYDIFLNRKIFDDQSSKIVIFILLSYIYVFIRYLFTNTLPDNVATFKLLSFNLIAFVYSCLYFKKYMTKNFLFIVRAIIIIEFIVIVLQTYGISNDQIFFLCNSTLENYTGKIGQLYRVSGTFNDPNYLALLIGTLLAFLTEFKNSKFDTIILFLGIVSILYTISRMGLIILALLITRIAIKKCSNVKNKLLIGIFVPFILILIIFIFQYLISNPSILLVAINEKLKNFYDFSDIGRTFIWKSYFENVLNGNNVIFGLGYEQFQLYISNYYYIPIQAHNEFIQIMADFGLVGLILYLGVILYTIILMRKSYLTNKNYFITPLAILVLGNMLLTTTLQTNMYVFHGIYLSIMYNNLRNGVIE